MKRRKVFTLFVLFLLIAASHLIAQDFYWENEEILVSSGAEFSRTASGGGVIASVWQDEVSSNNNGGSFYLSMAVSENGMDWSFNKRFLGPFNYTGKQSYFFSEVINDSGDIILAVSENDNSVRIYSSSDKGQTFSEISRLAAFPVRVSPYISLRSDGGFILFFTQETNKDNFGSLGIYYSVSDDGKSWTDNQSLAPNYNGNFLPSHTSYNGREYVAFQAFHIGSTSTFQIYIKYSDNGGVSWSDAQLLSDFKDTNEFFDGDPFVFDNQRPYLSTTPDGIKLVWERAYAGSNPQIYYADVNPDGTLKNNAEQVTSGSAECRSPKIIFHEGNEYLLWFDNRAGDYHNVLAYRDGLFWSEDDLNYDTRGSSFFGSVLSSGKDLYVVWENEYRGRNRLMLLSPDKTVTAPVLRASNFAAGRAAAQSNFIVRWNSPSDSSGIAGYSYSWSRDKDDVPEHDLKMLDKNRTVKIKLDEDGSWFFHLIAQDYAGNWSKPSVIEMNRDTTPPGKVVFTQPDLDDNGALLSNTSVINWTPPPDDDIAGYSYRLQYMGRWNWGGNIEDLRFKASASRVQTKGTTYSFRNIDNGMWALNIRAIDKVGNAGETESIVLRLNKYIPVTYITSIDSSKDALGSIKLELRGRGFSVGGLVKQVILDRDGRKPYDYVYNIEDELYTVKSDRIINGPVIENIDAGTYKIGLLHPRRGLYFTRSGIKIESSGTVKLGDFSSVPKPVISIAPKKKFTLPFKYIILSLIVIFLLFLFIITLRRTAKVVSEARVFKHQVTALIEGKDITDKEKEKRVAQMAKIRMGLRVKFILLFTILVLLVVAMISVPVTIMTLENQRKILATGLEDRAKVLLESITSGSRTFLPSENIIELSTLPAQMSALGDDAVYVTITSSGKSSEENYDPDIYDYVWVTNDKNISDKATSSGTYLMDDFISPRISALQESINTKAESEVSAISAEIERLNEQVEPLVSKFIRTGDASLEESINDIQNELRDLDTELNARLYDIGNQVSSFPQYNSEDLDDNITQYTFYKPIVFRSQNDKSYFRGVVRLGISTDGILTTITASSEQLIKIIAVIAAAAIVLGILGALILASIIVKPINKLVRGVEVIRDTEDKEDLKDHEIIIKTGDELSVLADTVNQMIDNLVEAASANKLLTVGKEVQKKFIPLEEDSTGNKLSTGKEDNENVEFFGYYEGARGVSGDYFDFRKIDDVHYAAIKCDVAGKGVPASLIMVEVATIFLNFFRNRKIVKTKSGKPVPPNISELTYSINDLVEEVGFTGRFAAFTIAIVNSLTGDIFLCNAGDNLVHIFDSSQQKMIIKELPESPASGVFPSDMVRMGKGFVQVKDRLKPGDCLLMFTDGLEEAQRHLRGSDFKVLKPEVTDEERSSMPESVNHDDGFEEFGVWRIQELINTLKAGGQYTLHKYYNPVADESLIFDFSDLEGTIEDIVLACVSVERIFRIYPDPSAGPDDRVRVDKVIVKFLEEHFNQWNVYFSNPLPGKDEDHYITFSHLKEDDQYDDLTVLGISKK